MAKVVVSAGFEYPQLRIQPEEIPEPALRDMARGWFNLTREYQSQPGAKERHEKWLEQYRARLEARRASNPAAERPDADGKIEDFDAAPRKEAKGHAEGQHSAST